MSHSRWLMAYYQSMAQALGPSHWWPAESPFEVCVGAILTQNTNWTNVSRAICALREGDLLDPKGLDELSTEELAPLIRPAGYFRVKAQRLKAFLAFLQTEADYDLEALVHAPLQEVRSKLLAVKGIGPETADSILLYALNKPTFVVDAYTARILHRHALVAEDVSYAELQAMFMDHLPQEVDLFQEYHALLVRVGKNWCKKSSARCSQCPLHPHMPEG